ncbi:acyl-CoA dehydrogenase [Novosphingobium sp. Fuku2-ISO-50]|jgi:acyl-CoA dehydrogenase|nr:acyl-CoA dehydrogenase [Novosphingobium sp. Fuku2-ISO-50]
MDFEYSERTQDLINRVSAFTDRYLLPQNQVWFHENEAGRHPSDIIEPLKELARDEGLWNLFLPALHPHEPGTRASNLEYAPLAEIMGKLPWASEIFNCSAPDTGNMELLHLFATPDQHDRWLVPLLKGDIRSCFCMTEPDVASSDATNITTRIRRDGDWYVINGRKWFATGALHPNCKFMIVLGVTDEADTAPAHKRHSMVIVPVDTPGMTIVRNVPVLHHLAVEGHCEILFRDVRVPVDHVLGTEGNGFALAQARLGPGRVHHCMRTIGQCELALDLMCERALERRAFGRALADYSNIRDWIAQSRIEIDQARLLVLRAAAMLDKYGNKKAKIDVSAIKVVAARLQTQVIDRAIQVFGAMGLTNDTPLAGFFSWGRALRFVDGPDEVHLRLIAKNEIDRVKSTLGSTSRYYTLPDSLG